MKVSLAPLFAFLLIVGCGDEIPIPTFVSCVACKHEVSSAGESCPSCGHPIKESVLAYRESYQPQPESNSYLVPDLELELIWVNSGKFQMGSPYTEKDRSEDEIPHWVTLTSGFYLGKTEVTRAQWNRVMGDKLNSNEDFEEPVDRVSWNKVNEFCKKLTEIERKAGRLPLGMIFQLPTEAQWEYACRAGTTSPFSTGENITLEQANFDRKFGGSSPICTYPPNPWGFYDMHGNVYEWCSDWYGDYETGSIKDPTGPKTGSSKVMRGGVWHHKPTQLGSARRYEERAEYELPSTGFRVSLGPKIKGKSTSLENH